MFLLRPIKVWMKLNDRSTQFTLVPLLLDKPKFDLVYQDTLKIEYRVIYDPAIDHFCLAGYSQEVDEFGNVTFCNIPFSTYRLDSAGRIKPNAVSTGYPVDAENSTGIVDISIAKVPKKQAENVHKILVEDVKTIHNKIREDTDFVLKKTIVKILGSDQINNKTILQNIFDHTPVHFHDIKTFNENVTKIRKLYSEALGRPLTPADDNMIIIFMQKMRSNSVTPNLASQFGENLSVFEESKQQDITRKEVIEFYTKSKDQAKIAIENSELSDLRQQRSMDNQLKNDIITPTYKILKAFAKTLNKSKYDDVD